MMDPQVQEAFDKLHQFMFDSVYTNPTAKKEEKKSTALIGGIYEYLMANKDKLPRTYLDIAEEDGLVTAVCDYISGMTDRYAVQFFSDIYIPKSWSY